MSHNGPKTSSRRYRSPLVALDKTKRKARGHPLAFFASMIQFIRNLRIRSLPPTLDNLRRGMVIFRRLNVGFSPHVALQEVKLLLRLEFKRADVLRRPLGRHRGQQGADGPVLAVQTASPPFSRPPEGRWFFWSASSSPDPLPLRCQYQPPFVTPSL